VARVLELAGPDRCVIWATIWRDGKPDDVFNDVLRAEAESNKRLRLVAWAEMVDKQPELLAADHLHGNEDGYRKRAEAVAEAVQSCAPGPSFARK
jgi:lysophospholipase L1-like esterase